MNNALVYIGGLLVLVLTGLFVAPVMIDWNGYRGVFEEEASKIFGRDVRVAGNVNVRLLPSPYVRFEQVRLADTSGRTGEPFLRAESFTMRLSGPPLLRGVVEARDIEFEKPVLSLAIDDDGRGNWQDLTLVRSSLPFVPRDVTLRSVRIVDGAISLFRPSVGLAARVSEIDGELSADSMRGPFRFQGEATWAGAQRTLRFATGVISDNSKFPLKATSQSAGGDLTVNLDASVEALSAAVKLDGRIDGRQRIADAGADTSGKDGASEAAFLEFKSGISADLSAIAFNDIELTLANTAVPQLMTGQAEVAWSDQPKSTLQLSAKWFDIDRLVGAGDGGAPFERLKTAALSTLGSLSGATDGAARIDIDQVRLGGESAGGLRIDVSRADGELRVREFRAGLPGGSRVGLSGFVKVHNGEPVFQGEGFIYGTSLARLRNWAEKSGAKIDIRADGPFSVEGQLLLSGSRFELTDASATIAKQPMTGDVKIIDDDRYRAEITLESARLPQGVLFPDTFAALDQELRRALGLKTAAGDDGHLDDGAGAETVAPMPDTRGAAIDINLRLLAGRLTYAGRTLTNVDTTINLEDGNIRIPAVRATTLQGLTISAEGHLEGSGQSSTGFLAFDADAPEKSALEELAALFGLEDDIGTERINSWQTGRMAGAVRFGARAPGTADITLDGLLGPARVTASAEFDQGLSAWRTAPTRIRVAADGASLERFLAGLGHGGAYVREAAANETGATSRAARIQIAAAGILGQDTRIKGLIESDPLTLGFEGAAAWPEGKPMVLTGQSHIDSDNARNVLALAGLQAPSGLSGTAVNGDIALTRSADGWRFAARRLTIGVSSIDVKGSLKRDAKGFATMDAEVRTDKVWLASVLGAMRQSMPEADLTSDDQGGVRPRSPVWPDDSLALNAFGDGRGQVQLTFESFEVEPGLATGPGTAVVEYQSGAMALKAFQAAALGGKAEGSLDVKSVPGGISVATSLAVTNAEASRVSRRSKGRFGVTLSAEGSGATLQSAVRLAQGSGTMTLDNVRAPQPSARVVADVVADVLGERLENRYDPIIASISAALHKSEKSTGTRQVAATITDGIATLEPIAWSADGGKTIAETKLDLVSLDVDSVWKLSAEPPRYAPDEVPDDWSPQQYDGTLPPLNVRYRGPVWAIGRLPATVDGNALHRDLVLLQTERAAQELSRLRLLDEQRGEEEAARIEALRREAEERRKAALEAQQRAEEEARQRAEEGEPALPPILPESYNSDGQTSSIGATVEETETGTTSVEAAEVEPDPQPVRRRPAPRPRTRAQSRTTTDEIMRSLGGYP